MVRVMLRDNPTDRIKFSNLLKYKVHCLESSIYKVIKSNCQQSLCKI